MKTTLAAKHGSAEEEDRAADMLADMHLQWHHMYVVHARVDRTIRHTIQGNRGITGTEH